MFDYLFLNLWHGIAFSKFKIMSIGLTVIEPLERRFVRKFKIIKFEC